MGFDWWSSVERVRRDKISSKKVGSCLSSRLVAGYGGIVAYGWRGDDDTAAFNNLDVITNIIPPFHRYNGSIQLLY